MTVKFRIFKNARERQGLTPEEVAVKSHVKAETIRRMEEGIPDTDALLDDICGVARALKIGLKAAVRRSYVASNV